MAIDYAIRLFLLESLSGLLLQLADGVLGGIDLAAVGLDLSYGAR